MAVGISENSDEKKQKENLSQNTNGQPKQTTLQGHKDKRQVDNDNSEKTQVDFEPLYEGHVCIICNREPAIAAFVCCCTHPILCYNCEFQITRCPYCRRGFDDRNAF